MARPFLLPPNVPADRVAALRTAFDATMADENFLADARTSRIDIQPMRGGDLQALINHIIGTTREIIDLAQQWMTQE
jgi:tripartite-type tricarboxylate transporter receptor subunit TctC